MDPFRSPESPDQDPVPTDGQAARQRAVEGILRATLGSVKFLAGVVEDDGAEPSLRVASAKAILTLGGVGILAQRGAERAGGADQTPPQIRGLLDLISPPGPTSPWASSAVNKRKCHHDHCDWPAHGGRTVECGHTREAGYKDGCGYNHSMMAECGPVTEGESTRSNFWKLRSA